MRGDIDTIVIKTTEGDWTIHSLDEHIYYIRYLVLRRAYKIKTSDNDYYISAKTIQAITVKYEEDYRYE